MSKKKFELPPVLGDSLAAGITKTIGKENYSKFQGRANDEPIPYSGKRSRSNIFKWHVKNIERVFGDGLIKTRISGEGKNQQAHISGVGLGDSGAMCFSQVCINARNVASYETHIKK